MIATPYDPPRDLDAWERLVSASPGATFLHTRRFLAYHRDRFRDRSLVFRAEPSGPLLAVLPAAEQPGRADTVVSHPGLTYGGLVHLDSVYGEALVELLDAARRRLRGWGYGRLLYKALPGFYQPRPQRDDLYALFRAGAREVRVDLSATIALGARGRISARRKRGRNKAAKAGVQVGEGSDAVEGFHDVLRENLATRHGAAPVHTAAEMRDLMARFPEGIELVTARAGERLVAGVWLFKDRGVHHAQYIAASPEGQATGALDLLFETLIARATAEGQRFFDFGISTEDGGRRLNAGLYQFKRQFGAGSTLHRTFELDLGRPG